ncbi:MAG: hypothetical protein ACQEUG_13240 [Pseudomonadota bacterium]
MTLTDLYQVARAALSGDARTMARASSALAAITESLYDSEMTPFRRDGLLTAIDIIADELGERADFLNEALEEDVNV